MASLSLPRVLQLKKNHLDAERENFEKFQSLAISKAINSQETPVKEKHVRSTIIGSFQEQGAVTYWVVAIRLPLQDNRIVSWKFCHVTHKLLREGHPACLDDSQRHIGMIENLGKLWVHLREGYGKLIKLYTTLLAGKLRFHQRNPQFPGNMAVSAEELDAIAENDVNNYFQLCVELFDYMDDILNLQAAVFDSLGNARANSMTASGQCRLAALIPCAQDSSHIYDCNVRLLFRLHAALPADVLAGHRERFRQQFKKLSAFYKHASTMQYFRNLLTLPQLPSNPPNFLIQSDFGTYVAPVVMIPEQEPEPEQDTVGSLIDTSDTMSQMTIPDTADFVDSRTSPSPQPDLVLERDRLIDHLQAELRRQRTELAHMADERSGMLVSMRDHCSKLEAELADAKSSLQQERAKAELLSAQTPEITQKLNEVEERAKLTDDKFQKLKGAYTQLRSEHIGLIRQKAEVDKVAASLRTVAAEHESAKTALQEELSVRSRDVEQLQQSASNNEAINTELEILRNEIISLRFDLDKSREKEKELEELKRSIEETRQQHRAKTLEAQEHILRIEEKTKELADELESTKQEKFENEKEFYNLREENMNLKTKRGDELSKALEEKKEVEKQVANLMQQFQQEKQDLLQHNTVLEENLGAVKIQLLQAQQELEKSRASLVQTAALTGVELLQQALAELEVKSAHESSAAAADRAANALHHLTAQQVEGEATEADVARSATRAAHHAVKLATHTADLLSTVTDNQLIDSVTGDTRTMLGLTKQCMEELARGDPSDKAQARARAEEARARVAALAERTASAVQAKGSVRTVDDELADMDAAIEEAAGRIEEMLAASRAADSGVKLEVNNKILDACTTLMGAVKVLVQDARKLQNELGDPKTRLKMYRRNPQWSEGLISAAKAVVVAAKLLVSSADEAVCGAGAIEGVSAASHEVAGSTAQLVAASRARAPPASPALAALSQASRNVAAATGAVVAAVRAVSALTRDNDDLETSALTLTATRRLEMESKVRSLELECALDAERARLAALRRRHYQLAQQEENGNITNGGH